MVLLNQCQLTQSRVLTLEFKSPEGFEVPRATKNSTMTKKLLEGLYCFFLLLSIYLWDGYTVRLKEM